MKYTIEIATNDFTTAKAAYEGGADRIELCTALSEGGLTPSFGLIQQCRKEFSLPIFPIVRPRSGDFLYTDEEFDIIKKDALLCKQLGCDGVVIGFLNKDGTINKKYTATIVDMVYPLEVTFHRAFDRCVRPFEALDDIVEAGCQRILTSGQQQTATDGIALIKELIIAAANEIIIMPGSGVQIDNIKNLAEQTSAVEFHASLRRKVKSNMEFLHPSFSGTDDYLQLAIDKEAVAALRNVASGDTKK